MNTVLRRLGFTVAVATTVTVAAGGVASAHLAVEAPGAKPGSSSVLTFRISNESEHAFTTALTIDLPGLKTARTEPLPGWNATVTRDPSTMATSVTWNADTDATVGPGQFQRFALYAGPLPAVDTIAFRAVQTYSDGTIVTWDQPSLAGAPEPEYPLPVLVLAGSPTVGESHSHSSESAAAPTPAHAEPGDTTRQLAIAGLALGVLAVAAAVTALFRARRASR
ncbi:MULTISPECIES: YcnI family copper-binding membrane protein [Nocardia]|uniref:YcnI family copper-binding membrane protein n=1 Tax=Nocardia TaxID=1817 RepID=UPI00030F0CF1|nr:MULTISPECIES: YcnI family protein [Nocardia]